MSNGQRLILLTFAYSLTNPEPEEQWLPESYTGTVLFAPDSYWAMIELHIDTRDSREEVESGRIEVKNRIEHVFRGCPVLVESQVNWFDLTGELVQRFSAKYDWKEFTGDETAFSLSAYGFPELAGSQPDRTRLWAIVVTVALLVLLIVIFSYRQWCKQ